MNSNFSFNHYLGFFLNQQVFEKTHKLISSQINSEINYTIYRFSGFSYQTQELKTVFEEDNSGEEKIKSIKIETEEKTDYKYQIRVIIEFSYSKTRYSTVNLYVQGEDRYRVENIGREIKNFLIKKVISRNFFSPFILLTAVMADYPDLFILFNLIFSFFTGRFLANGNFEMKKVFSSLVVSSFFLLIFKILNYLFPACLFLLGEEINVHEQRKQLRKNLFWVVIVGLILSILAGIITAKYLS